MKQLFIKIFILWIAYLVQGDIDKWPSVENDHTKLQFVLPEILQLKDKGYQHKDALFGYPGYTLGSLQTSVFYTNETSTLCELDSKLYNLTSKFQPPFALIIDRGNCHFTLKVRNAQHAGARAVIIADNKCLCSDTECMRTTGDVFCEAILPYMADDESGGDISIPSMLIRKSDAEQVKKHMKLKYADDEKITSNVMVKFDWGIPSPDGRVEWTLWHSAWDEQSGSTLREVEAMVEALGKRAFFVPHFVSYNGSNVGCYLDNMQYDNTNPCGNMCLNNGRYCLLDPSPFHDQENGASGADVITENLRRKCIWNLTSVEDPGVGIKWWKYVNEFDVDCSSDENLFKNNQCAEKIMIKVGIDYKAVEKCMQPYGPKVDVINPVLEEELKQQTKLQLLRLPALYVDGVHARGTINGPGILGMVCAGYGNHNPPAVCQCVTGAPMGMMDCVEKGGYVNLAKEFNKNSGVGFGTVLFIIIFVAGTVASAGFVYWRRTQRHMREQVRSILAEYMPLEDQSFEGELDSPRAHPAVVAAARSPRGYLPTSGSGFDDEDGV